MPVSHKKCSKSIALKELLNLVIIKANDNSTIKYISSKDIFLSLEN